MHRDIERIILDECLPSTPELLEEIERLIGTRPVEILALAETYPGLPDMIILEKLMNDRSILVTQDRPLHNLAIDRGFTSLLRTPERSWTSGRVALVAQRGEFPATGPLAPEDHLPPQMSPEAADINGILNGFRSEKEAKHLRTKRRRIRAHFGTPANIGAVALTVAQRRTERGSVGGYKLKVDSRHGTKGLFPASEGYFLDSGDHEHPLLATGWALGQLYGLHLHDWPLTVYHLDATAGDRCKVLKAEPSQAADPIEWMTVRLFADVASITFLSCKKGRFFEKMTEKLIQLSEWKSNELITVDLHAVATSLAPKNG